MKAETKFMLRNEDGDFYGGIGLLFESDRLNSAIHFATHEEAVKVCANLFRSFPGDKPFSVVRMAAEPFGRHGKRWHVAACEECTNFPATFSDPTHDSAIGPAQWLCYDCAKYRIEMTMMDLSAVRQ